MSTGRPKAARWSGTRLNSTGPSCRTLRSTCSNRHCARHRRHPEATDRHTAPLCSQQNSCTRRDNGPRHHLTTRSHRRHRLHRLSSSGIDPRSTRRGHCRGSHRFHRPHCCHTPRRTSRARDRASRSACSTGCSHSSRPRAGSRCCWCTRARNNSAYLSFRRGRCTRSPFGSRRSHCTAGDTRYRIHQ